MDDDTRTGPPWSASGDGMSAAPYDPAIPPASADQPQVVGYRSDSAPEPYPPEPEQASPPPTDKGAGRGTGCALIALAALVAFVVAAFAGLAAGFLGGRLAEGSIQMPTGGATRTVRVVPSRTQEPVAAAAAAALPSVVNIDVRSGSASGGESGLPEGHDSVPAVGNGSGVAFRQDGETTYIITNNHVVEGAKRITVRDPEGRSVDAKIVGLDPESDVAVISIKGRIPVVEVGDSEALNVGQTVVAIGSPFGLEHSVTSGVISALGRSLPDFTGESSSAYPLVDVIQTDAAINPGNSGGALVDRVGKLIGINTAIYSGTGASGGIGFAIPSDTVVRVAEQLIEGGDVTHPFIGVVGQTVTPEFAQEEGLEVEEGAYVADFSEGSGAQEAGIRVGDVVVAVGGEPVRSMDDLILQVRRKKVGETVEVTVRRGARTMEFEVKVGDKPADLATPESDDGTPSPQE